MTATASMAVGVDPVLDRLSPPRTTNSSHCGVLGTGSASVRSFRVALASATASSAAAAASGETGSALTAGSFFSTALRVALTSPEGVTMEATATSADSAATARTWW